MIGIHVAIMNRKNSALRIFVMFLPVVGLKSDFQPLRLSASSIQRKTG